MLQDLGNLINVAITYFDPDYNSTSAYSISANTRICSLIKSCRRGECDLSNQNAFNQLQNKENAIYYSCHFGFMEMAFRLTDKNISYGYILVGPFRAPNATKRDITSLEELCKITDADYKQVLQYYHKLTRFSLEKFYSLKNLLFSLFEYAKSQQVIFENSNTFTHIIEPFIKQNLQENLNIEFLCKKFFLTQRQLYTVFDANTHMTPKHYIAQQRVNKARELIITTDMRLPDISAEVGILDYNYFIKIFKTYDGHTPMYYRKKITNVKHN